MALVPTDSLEGNRRHRIRITHASVTDMRENKGLVNPIDLLWH
jgi:hypothetical protein